MSVRALIDVFAVTSGNDLAFSLCEYNWPNFTSVLEFVNFNQMVSRSLQSQILAVKLTNPSLPL